MAKIPDFTALGNASPRALGGTPRVSGETAVSDALSDFGATASGILEKRYDRESDLAYAAAKLEHQRGLIGISAKVQESPDYQGWQSEYEKLSEKARAEVGSKIADPRMRQNFELEAQGESLRLGTMIADRARVRGVETQRAGLDLSFNENLAAVANAPDEQSRSSIILGTRDLFSAAAARGIITPEESVAKQKAFVETGAEQWANRLDPASRVKALQAGLTRGEAKPTIFSKGALADGSLPGRQGNLDRTKAGDNWATFEVSEDGIPAHLVLPTTPGDNNTANDATGFLGDAVERYRKTGKYYGGFDTDEAGANAMRGTPTGGYASFAKTGTPADFIQTDRRLKMIEAAQIDARQQLLLEDQQREIANREIENGFLVRLQANKLTAQEILASPLRPEKKEHYLDNLKQMNSGAEWPTNKSLFVSLWDRVHLPAGDPRKITDEDQLQQFVRPGALSVEMHNQLRGEVQGRRSSEGSVDSELKRGLVQVAKSKLTGTDPLLKLRDPKGDENLQRWMAQFLPAWDMAVKLGKSPQELADPDSPEYLGKGIERLVRPPSQMIKDMMEAGGGMTGALGATPPTAPAAAPVVKIGNDAEYAKLPSGARFIGPDGKTRRKP